MIMVPINPSEREIAIDLFLDDMAHRRLTVFDADAMLSQLRIIGDVCNLERLSKALAARGCA